MDDEKQIRWVGSAYDDLLAFPKGARKEAGFQLGKVQAGLEPSSWKPFDNVGADVLHCFQKKTEATSKQDQAIALCRRDKKQNNRGDARDWLRASGLSAF